MNEPRFFQRTALITGAGTGIGRSISEQLLAEGANVVLAARDESRLRSTARALDPDGARTHVVACDVTREADARAAVVQATRRFGSLDILVNNAGTVTIGECVNLTEEDWDLVMDVNVKGVFLMTKAVIPDMIERGAGQVINIASQAGKRGYPKLSHYCASKAAVINLTRALAVELAPAIRVNAVCPGIVNTDMMDREYRWEEELTGVPPTELHRRWLASIPLGRFQEPVDVARCVAFLASDDAKEITGVALNVTGGAVSE